MRARQEKVRVNLLHVQGAKAYTCPEPDMATRRRIEEPRT